MFRRLSTTLPEDPSYPISLKDLGYELNANNQFTRIGTAPDDKPRFFNFFVTDNERANEVHKEAMHICARRAVREQLAELGMREVYCHGPDEDGHAGVQVCEEKPHGAHMPILVSAGLDGLKNRTEVLVVVGEHMQDLGVWAYRLLMREGGVEHGSAVGLARKLKSLDDQVSHHNDHPLPAPYSMHGVQNQRPMMKRTETVGQIATAKASVEELIRQSLDASDHVMESLRKKVSGFTLSSNASTDSNGVSTNATPAGTAPNTPVIQAQDEQVTAEAPPPEPKKHSFAPGLIILNPGALLYSPSQNTTMSQATWLVRPRRNAIDDAIRIDATHNIVPGHRTPEEHVRTCLELIIPQLINDDAKVFLVGISDGAETAVQWMDEQLSPRRNGDGAVRLHGPQNNATLAEKVVGMALMEPMHQHSQLHSPALKTLLLEGGRSWIASPRPKGTVEKVPSSLQPGVTQLALLGNAATLVGAEEEVSVIAGTDNELTVGQDGGAGDECNPYTSEEVSCVTLSSGTERGITELVCPAVMDAVLEFFQEFNGVVAEGPKGMGSEVEKKVDEKSTTDEMDEGHPGCA